LQIEQKTTRKTLDAAQARTGKLEHVNRLDCGSDEHLTIQRQLNSATACVQELEVANGELRISQQTIENERDSVMALSSGLKLRNHQPESENEQIRIANPRISELGQQDVELRSLNRRLLSNHEIMNIGLDHVRAPELTVQALGNE
jgi:hypothetical protein